MYQNFSSLLKVKALVAAIAAMGSGVALAQSYNVGTGSQPATPPSSLSLPIPSAPSNTEAAPAKPAEQKAVPVNPQVIGPAQPMPSFPAAGAPSLDTGTNSAIKKQSEPVEKTTAKEPKPKQKVVVVKKTLEVQKAPEPVKYEAQSNEIIVSDRDYNHFVFNSPISQLLFPAGAPIEGEAQYLSNNTQVLVQFTRGSDKPFQMIVELENGEVHKEYLKARPVKGVFKKFDSKLKNHSPNTPRASENSVGQAEQVSAGAKDIELLKRMLSGDLPGDFENVALPGITRFDKFTAIPLTGYSNGVKRIFVFSLVAVPGQSAIVAPPMFYRQGITAVMLDGDTVNNEISPQLYVVEDETNE